jgi:hypothetical protein
LQSTLQPALRRQIARRLTARGSGTGPQVGQLRPSMARIGLVLSRRAPPAALPEPGRGTARHHARDRDRDDDDEQRQRDATAGALELNGSNDTVTG